jgi:surfeit locus 1 family protein
MHEKEALFATFERGAAAIAELGPGTADWQRVRVTGRYVPERQILLDNMTHEGRAGFQVLTPLRRENGAALLVNRGWVPMGASRSDLPQIDVADDRRTVVGRVHTLPRPGLRAGAAAPAEGPWPRVMSYPTIADVRDALRMEVDERVILLDPEQPDGYVRAWRPSTFPPERHLGYAVTWFALAATVLAAYVITAFKGPEPRA